MNSDDLDAPRRALHGSDADPVAPADFVTITESRVTRAIFQHSPNPSGGIPLVFDVTATLNRRIVIGGVQIRALIPRGFELVWPGLLNATIDGVPCEAFVASRARRRIGKRLVDLLVQGDIGRELG